MMFIVLRVMLRSIVSLVGLSENMGKNSGCLLLKEVLKVFPSVVPSEQFTL